MVLLTPHRRKLASDAERTPRAPRCVARRSLWLIYLPSDAYTAIACFYRVDCTTAGRARLGGRLVSGANRNLFQLSAQIAFAFYKIAGSSALSGPLSTLEFHLL